MIFASEALFLGIFIMSEAEAALNVLEIRDGKLKWIVLATIQCKQASAVQRGEMLFKITTAFSMEKTGVGIGNNLHN